MQNNKPSLRRALWGALQGAVMVLAVLAALSGVSQVLRNKGGDANILLDPAFERQGLDVIFAGSSHMNRCIYPMQCWRDQGFASYNNAQSGQVLPISYFACKDVIERSHPKVLVLDLYMLFNTTPCGSLTWAHQGLDTLRWYNRIPAVMELIPSGNKKEFLFPLTLYHTRWKELRQTDFCLQDALLRGSQPGYEVTHDLDGLTLAIEPASVQARPPEISVQYLERIVQLCRQTGTELLLITLPYFTHPDVAGPTHDMGMDQAYFNWAAAFAADNGVDYINYFHLIDEIGFDWYNDMLDYSHINYWGGERLTAHLGAYLAGRYDLPDRRQDPAYQNWNDDVPRYEEAVRQKMQEAAASDEAAE